MSLQVWLFDEQERGGKFKRPEVTFWIEERPSQIRRLFFFFFGFWMLAVSFKKKILWKPSINERNVYSMQIKVCCHLPSGIQNKPQLVNILKQIEMDISGICKEKHSSRSNMLCKRTLIMLFY